MKDQLCLFSLCKWGDFAFGAWKWGRFYLISAEQQHMSIFFLQIFCLGRDDVGKCSDVVVFLWKYTYVCVCVAIYFGGISGALWIDELCPRWEQKHFFQPLFGRRETVDLCCAMGFTDFNFIATRTVICKSALPIAAQQQVYLEILGGYFGWGLRCLSRLRIPESCLNPGIRATEFRALTGLGIYLVELHSS